MLTSFWKEQNDHCMFMLSLGDQLCHGEYFLKSHKWTLIVDSEQNDSEKWLSHNLGVEAIPVGHSSHSISNHLLMDVDIWIWSAK